ncbi:MAG: YIP1 family protein [Candidatus Hodarchaeota archaeon]
MSKLRCPECLIRVESQDATCPQCGYRFRTEQFERILPFMRRPEQQWDKRLTLIQRLWGIIRFPAVAFWDIAHELDRKGPALIFIGNLTLISLWYVALASHIVGATVSLLFGFFGVFVILAALYMLLNLFYFGLIQLLIGLTGRKGMLAETFLMGQYAHLPLFFANLLSFVVLMLGLPYATLGNLASLYLSPLWLIVYGLLSIGLLWGALLLAMGIRERYRLTTNIALTITMGVTLFMIIVAVLVRVTVLPVI